VIFANQECDRLNNKYEYYCSTLSAEDEVGCNQYYYTNSVPDWAMNNGFINATASSIDNDGILDAMGNTVMPYLNDPEFNISAYYKTASFGDFIVTADVVSVEIPAPGTISQVPNPEFDGTQPIDPVNNPEFIDEFDCGSFNRDDIVNAAFSQHPNLNPADYDNRNNYAFSVDNFLYDNSSGTSPDYILDYVAIIKKIRTRNAKSAGYISPSYQQGITLNAFDNQNNQYKLGYHHVHDKTHNSNWSHMNLFIHEFAHNIGLDHNGGANGVVFDKFNVTGDWGMITAQVSQFWVPKAHSMWLYGWLDDGDVHDIDPQVTNTVTIKLSDLLTTPLGNPTNTDPLTPKNAARVKIPNTDNQYLWIENHQKIHPSGFEEMNAYIRDPNNPWEHQHTTTGLYMYITDVENDLGDPKGHTKEIWPYDDNSNNTYMLHPDGKKDYNMVFEADGITPVLEQPDGDLWEPDKVQPKLVIVNDNPIAGSIAREGHRMNDPDKVDDDENPLHQNEIAYRNDYNDGNYGSDINEYFGVKFDIDQPGKRVTHIDVERTAFVEGDELSINGIFPILNFRRFHEFPLQGQRQQEPFTLTGLKVEVLSKTTVNGADEYSLRISNDDWSFSSDKRWCDAINLPGNETLTVTGQSNLSLELSGTANRTTYYPHKDREDPFIKNFVDPTILTAQPNSSIIIENNSCINIKEESTLQIEDLATLHLKTGGFLHVKDEDSKLVLDDRSILYMEDDSYIEIKNGGTLEINTDNLNLTQPDSRIIVNAGGILTTTTGQTFNFDGLGKLIIKEGAIIDMPFNLTGEGPNHVAILLDDDFNTSNVAASIDMEHNFRLVDCKVSYENESTIAINGKAVSLINVTFEPASFALGTSTAFTGNNLKAFTCKDSRFNDFVSAIVLNDYFEVLPDPVDVCDVPVQPTFKVQNSHFENIEQYAISCSEIYRLFANNNNFSNDAIGVHPQTGIYGEQCSFELVDNSIEKYRFGVYLDGILSNSTEVLNISGGTINNCNTGVRSVNVNVNVKYCADISDNLEGIRSSAAAQQRQLTVGRKGGATVTGNDVAIKCDDMILDIDAHSGTNVANDMSGNIVFFDLSYHPNTSAPAGLAVRGNYWGADPDGCGESIHYFQNAVNQTGSYIVPNGMTVSDSPYLNVPPGSDCSPSNSNGCDDGTTGPGGDGEISTNFDVIYNISSDYLEEQQYVNAHFGYSIVADFEDAPIYNSLQINDQNLVVLSRVQSETIQPYTDDEEGCLGRVSVAHLYPGVNIARPQIEAIKLIENVSPNPFTHTITLSTFIKNETYTVDILDAYDINGRSLLQFKTEGQQFKIDVSALKPGIYALRVTDSAGRTDYREILKAY